MTLLAPNRLAVPVASRRRTSSFGRRLLDRLLAWQERSRQRQQLAQLGGHELADLGLTPDQVACECAKPFWR